MSTHNVKFYFLAKDDPQMKQIENVLMGWVREDDFMKLIKFAEDAASSKEYLLAMSINEFLILQSNLPQKIRFDQMRHLADNFACIWHSDYTPPSWSVSLLLDFAKISRFCLDNDVYNDKRHGYYEVGMYLRNYYLATNERYYNNLAISFFEKAGDYYKAREKYRISCDISLSWGTGASISQLQNPEEEFKGYPHTTPIVPKLARGFGY